MKIIEDTRQQAGKHDTKHEQWFEAGVELIRSKLAFGDYALPPVVAVDTKASILELAMDIDQQHERFRRELIAAQEAGCLLVILTENEDGVTDLATLSTWQNPRRFINERRGLRPPITGARLAKACMTMQRRYGARFEFCRPDEAAARVVEILIEEGGRDGRNIAP